MCLHFTWQIIHVMIITLPYRTLMHQTGEEHTWIQLEFGGRDQFESSCKIYVWAIATESNATVVEVSLRPAQRQPSAQPVSSSVADSQHKFCTRCRVGMSTCLWMDMPQIRFTNRGGSWTTIFLKILATFQDVLQTKKLKLPITYMRNVANQFHPWLWPM